MTGPYHRNFGDVPCPCESGRLSRNCCLASDGVFRPSRCKIGAPDRTTGYSHPSCYAGSLNDCSHDISREHYISSSVLKLLSQKNKFGARGFHWLPPGDNLASPEAFTAKILCSRHNNALAPLDQIAARLYRSWATVLFDFGAIEPFRKPDRNSWWWDYSQRSRDRLFLFNGHDIEQWLLKLLCGFVFSGNSSVSGNRLTGWRPDEKWVRILFGKNDLPKGWGLHLANGATERLVADYGLSLAPLHDRSSDAVVGLRCWINGIQFVLAMMQPDADGTFTLHDSSNMESKQTVGYRPRQLNLHDGDHRRVFEFYWDHPGDGTNLQVEFDRHRSIIGDTLSQGCCPGHHAVSTLPELRWNGPCPCGSGKKYKLCHARLGNADKGG